MEENVRVRILGSGTGVIRPERRSPAVLVETEEDKLLLDAGWGVPGALLELGPDFDINLITNIAISHRHADHFVLAPILQHDYIVKMRGYGGKPRQKKLVLHGYPKTEKHSGFREDLEALLAMQVPEIDIDQDLTIIEHGEGTVHQMGSLAIRGTSVRHVEAMPSVAYVVETGGKKIFLSGDLGWEEDEQKRAELVEHIRDADIGIVDASATHQEYVDQPVRSHLAPIQCGLLAARAGIKHLVLTSLTDREDEGFIIKKVRESGYDGELTLAEDGQVIDLGRTT